MVNGFATKTGQSKQAGRPARVIPWAITAAALLVVQQPSGGQQLSEFSAPPTLIDNMDGQNATLRLINADRSTLVVNHFPDRSQTRFGRSAEHVIYRAPAGESAQFLKKIPFTYAIDEGRIVCWARCSRPGLVLAANVVLPRSRDPNTGEPLQLTIRSRISSSEQEWMMLQLDRLRTAVAAEARVARAGIENGATIDEREAYVSDIELLAPGGQGDSQLIVDQIVVYGVLSRRQRVSGDPANPIGDVWPEPRANSAQSDTSRNETPHSPPPAFPRVIQWQGESFDQLAKLGFDAVLFGRTPQPRELEQLERLELWAVCPPLPRAASGAVPAGGVQIHPSILAWDLGEPLVNNDLDQAQLMRRRIDHQDQQGRPVIIRPGRFPRQASRIADTLLLGDASLGSSLSLPDYSRQLAFRQRLLRPGTTVWMTSATHLDVRQQTQLAMLRGGRAPAVPATYGSMTRQINASLPMRPRGILFESLAHLSPDDPANQLRAYALELTNLRLGLLDPWLSSGEPSAAATSTSAGVTGLVLKTERSFLVVPIHAREDAAAGPEDAITAFTLPGTPETSRAYLVTPAGSKKLRTRRVAGGLQIAVDQLPPDSLILATEDGQAFSQMERFVRRHATRAATLRLGMAQLKLQEASRAVRLLPDELRSLSKLQLVMAECDALLRQGRKLEQQRKISDAYLAAARCDELLDAAAAMLHETVRGGRPGEWAFAFGWSTLPDAVRMSGLLRSADARPEPILGGEFEDLATLLESGWRRAQPKIKGVSAAVRLSSEAPAAGNYSLELAADLAIPGEPPPASTTPLVWVRSPELQVDQGGLVEISGKVRTPARISGQTGALLIYDSIAGEKLAVRIKAAPEWETFRIVRTVQVGANMHLTIALDGLGRAQVDSLQMRSIPLVHSYGPEPPPAPATANLFPFRAAR